MQKMEWKPDQRGEKKGKINASFLLGRGWEKALFPRALCCSRARVCRPLPVLSPNVAIFFNDVAPPRRLGEDYYILALKWWGMGRFQRPGGPGYPIHCAAHVPIAG